MSTFLSVIVPLVPLIVILCVTKMVLRRARSVRDHELVSSAGKWSLAAMLAVYLLSSVLGGEMVAVEYPIVEKHRVHDYKNSSKPCTIAIDGREYTNTCITTTYTVTWLARAENRNALVLGYLESQTEDVYDAPDPAKYIDTQIGDPIRGTVPKLGSPMQYPLLVIVMTLLLCVIIVCSFPRPARPSNKAE